MSVHTDVWAKFIPGGAAQGSPCPLQTHLSWAGWSAPYFFIFTKSYHFKSPCRAISKLQKYLRKPINSYNDINNIFVNANLLLCFPQAQPEGSVKGQHGSSRSRHMGTFTGKQQLLPSSHPGYTHTPLAAFQGLISLWGSGSWAQPRWWLPAWFGFCSRSCAAPRTLAGSTQSHTAGKSPPMTFDTSTRRQLNVRFFKAKPMNFFLFVQWIPTIQVINLN